jgi:hypothetical protein
LNPGRRGGKPATNRLSYGAAFVILTIFKIIDFMDIIHHLALRLQLLSFRQ